MTLALPGDVYAQYPAFDFALSDSRFLVKTPSSVRIWSLSGALRAEAPDRTLVPPTGRTFTHAVFSPGRGDLLTMTDDGRAALEAPGRPTLELAAWDIGVAILGQPDNGYLPFAFSPSGRLFSYFDKGRSATVLVDLDDAELEPLRDPLLFPTGQGLRVQSAVNPAEDLFAHSVLQASSELTVGPFRGPTLARHACAILGRDIAAAEYEAALFAPKPGPLCPFE